MIAVRRILSLWIIGILLNIGSLAAQEQKTVADTMNGAATVFYVRGDRIVRHDYLLGVGHLNVLDTYLSPLEYTGVNLSLTHRSERKTRCHNGRITRMNFYTAHISRPSSQADNRHEWDADLLGAVGWHYNFCPLPDFRLAVGGMAEFGGGFTYNTKGGNNPAQGRLFADVALSLLAEYDFDVKGKSWSVCGQLDVPLLGAAFTPRYGQSYYEIFALGHTDNNVCFTHIAKAPSLRFLGMVRIPLGRATITAGYMADIRQSDMVGLKRHSWGNSLVVGYTRRVMLIK